MSNRGPQGPQGVQGPRGADFTTTPYGPSHAPAQRGHTPAQRAAYELPEYFKGVPHERMACRDESTHVPAAVGVEKRVIEFFSASKRVRGGPDVECPFCRAAMVVRARLRDGRMFLGCMRYPSCSGSHDIPDVAQEESRRWERQLMTSDRASASLDQQKRAQDLADSRAHLPDFSDISENPEKETNMETQTDMKSSGDIAIPGIAARLKRSAAKAPYRMARMRALTEGRKALLAALRPRVQPAAFDIVEAFLDTDAGQGAIIGAIGLAGPLTPKFGKNKHVQALCEEFLDEGVAKGFNQVLGLLASIVEPALASAASSIPELSEVADKVVPKRRKKRVASAPVEARVARGPDPEAQDDESQSRPLRAVASR